MFRTGSAFSRLFCAPTSAILRQGGGKVLTTEGASSLTRWFCVNKNQSNMAEVHEGARPLSWLLGQWESIEAKGTFPNTTPFDYTENLSITHLGQPVLNFHSETWMEGVPKHIESGFIRQEPGTTKVAYICAQNVGIVEIEEGELNGTSIDFTELSILRTTFAKEAGATGLKRTFRLDSEGILEQIVFMTTPKVPLMAKHLHVKYKKKDA